jgi:ABC-type transporter Mla maintaining outer membrane lipid asymmetry ATPase subunit MlaF
VTPGVRPLIEITGLVKAVAADAWLRVADLVVAPGDRLQLGGLDARAAEMLVHLVTGAALPDEGLVRVAGRSTGEIATASDWLSSLDAFGLVTDRAVLLASLTVEANLALPLTVSIDPPPAAVRERVRRLAADAGLAADRLDRPVSSLSAEDRARVHLARAFATDPALLLLEHPTSGLDGASASAAVGAALRAAADRRGIGWLAISNDDGFARASGARRLRIDRATGEIAAARPGWFARVIGRRPAPAGPRAAEEGPAE